MKRDITKIRLGIIVTCILLVMSGCPDSGFETSEALINLDMAWEFHLGDAVLNNQGKLDATSMRIVNLPHDWSIEGHYSKENGASWQSGFLPAGIGWYQKNLPWQESWRGKCVKIHFEGIYLNSDVWINGHHLGHRPNGYVGMEYDLTDYLTEGENTIAVKVDHSKPLTGRWYTGSGIYRHVWLKVKNEVHIDNWGVSFTSPHISAQKASYQVEVSLVNVNKRAKDLLVQAQLKNTKGEIVGKCERDVSVTPELEQSFVLNGIIANPVLWSPDNPYLYDLEVSVRDGNESLDVDHQKVGFRKLDFSSEFGFKLNDSILKLKGVCDHHTAGAVGAAVPDDILLYRLKLLKNMGCNAIRTAHNPFSPSFYNICDSLGLMVMNEFLDGWNHEKAPHDYGLYFEDWWQRDAIDFIKRDRNHPSVIIWSIGNEVKKPSRKVQKKLINLFRTYDPKRPVTQGGHDPTRGMKGIELATLLDIKGFNGDGEEIGVLEAFHTKEPQVPIVCTEVPHTYQTQGVYRTSTHWRRKDFPAQWEIKKWDGTMTVLENKIYPITDLADQEVFPEEKCNTWYCNGVEYPIELTKSYQPYLYYQSSYDNASVRSSARKAWQRTRDLDFVMGQFRWGSYDYLGETNGWPSRFANFGVLDICGFPKDHYFLYQSMWTDEPMVHVLPHWTHLGKEGIEIPVVVYTNCDEVELILNGKSLGTKAYEDEQLVWKVPYEAGTLKAVARRNGNVVSEMTQTTAEKASKVLLTAHRKNVNANRSDVVLIAVDITDHKGTKCPQAAHELRFDVTGPAVILGVDNADPLDLSDYKSNRRRTFRGQALLLIQTTNEPGVIKVEAVSEGLERGKVVIKSVK